jgi:hypothetical protein
MHNKICGYYILKSENHRYELLRKMKFFLEAGVYLLCTETLCSQFSADKFSMHIDVF